MFVHFFALKKNDGERVCLWLSFFVCVCVNLRIISDTMSGRKLKCIEICFHACITWTIIPIRLNDYIASHPGKQMEILLARVKALEEHAVFFFSCIITHPKTIQDLHISSRHLKLKLFKRKSRMKMYILMWKKSFIAEKQKQSQTAAINCINWVKNSILIKNVKASCSLRFLPQSLFSWSCLQLD